MNQCFAVIPPTVVTLMILLLTSMQGKDMVQLLETKTITNLGKETSVHISSREKDSERKSPKKPIYLRKTRGQNFRDFCCKFERQFFKNKEKNK